MKGSEQNSGKFLPLYIGITGHRNIRIEDRDSLKKQIISILNEMIRKCPNTPVILLTALAEGADRLAAYAAIECGIPYIAPLPMEPEEYSKDFADPVSLKEFRDLLSGAISWYALPQVNSEDMKSLSASEWREEQYDQNGKFIAGNSCLLIALWDGIDNQKKAGTAYIVKLKKSGIPTINPHLQQRLNILRSGWIYHIITPRTGEPFPEDAFKKKMIYPGNLKESAGKKKEQSLLKNLDDYNHDVSRLKSSDFENIDRDLGKYPGDIIEKIPELESIALHQTVSDRMADNFHRKRFFALKVLLVLTVIAFLFFQVYVEFWHKPAILLMYPLTMGIGALWFLRANRNKFEQKHEDYRALAEAFRVQFYLSLMDKTTSAADYYLQKYTGDLEWILYALRTIVPAHMSVSEDSQKTDRLKSCRYIADNWVSEQIDYYHKKSLQHHNRHDRYRFTGNTLFMSAIISALILFVLSFLENKQSVMPEHSYDLLHRILVVCTHSFLVLSGAVFGYNEKRIFSEQSKTFQKMYQLFSHAHEKLEKNITGGNYRESEEIIRELALESLMENSDWLLLHRSRPMEIPRG